METLELLKELLSFNVSKRVQKGYNNVNMIHGDISTQIEKYIEKVNEEYVFIPRVKMSSEEDIRIPNIDDSRNILIKTISEALQILSDENNPK